MVTAPTWWFREMYLHDGDERRVQVIRLRLLRIQDLHRVRPAGDGEDRLKNKHGTDQYSVSTLSRTI